MGRIQKETSKVGTPEQRTEIRNYGDGKTIVVYTTNNEVYQSLKKGAEKEVPYEIWKNCDPLKQRKWQLTSTSPEVKKSP